MTEWKLRGYVTPEDFGGDVQKTLDAAEELMKKVARFNYFRFENTASPTIIIDSNNFSTLGAVNYFVEFLAC